MPAAATLLPRHSAHDSVALLAAWQRLAKSTGMAVTQLTECAGLPVLALTSRAAVQGQQPSVYLSSGVHGDEPGAAWGLLGWAMAHRDMLRREAFIICPCLNPVGLGANTRVDHRGLDLNRRFHMPRDPVCGPWLRFIKPHRLSLAMCLHEDYDGQGTYIYELGTEPRAQYAEAALEASASVLPRDLRKHIDGHAAQRGIIHYRTLPEGIAGPEALMLWRLGCPLTMTIETPSEFSLDDRAQAHQHCIRATLEYHAQHRRE